MLTSDFKEFAELLNSNQVEYRPCRIDLLTSIDGVDFVDCVARRMAVTVDGVALSFIALDDFKINKKAVGRLQDLADLETLARLAVIIS